MNTILNIASSDGVLAIVTLLLPAGFDRARLYLRWRNSGLLATIKPSAGDGIGQIAGQKQIGSRIPSDSDHMCRSARCLKNSWAHVIDITHYVVDPPEGCHFGLYCI